MNCTVYVCTVYIFAVQIDRLSVFPTVQVSSCTVCIVSTVDPCVYYFLVLRESPVVARECSTY